MRPDSPQPAPDIGTPTSGDWAVFTAWAAQEGWRVPARELDLYRRELADSAFVLRTADGRPKGFVTICRHRNSAWIGNLLVDPARRGQGTGRQLFEEVVGVLSAGGASTLWLTASAAGRHLYATCGFAEVGRIERWVCQTERAGRDLPGDRHVDALPALLAADAEAWGDSRTGLLTLLARNSRVLAADGAVALLQSGDDLNVIGPWLSPTLCPRANRTILAEALDSCDNGGEIAIDLVGGSPIRSLLPAAGFHQAGETLLMRRGACVEGLPGAIVALASLGSMG